MLKWLKKHPRFHLHITPTSSSWLSVIERWFRDITQNRIRKGVFRSVSELEQAIRDDILDKVARARKALNKTPTA